jgi:hypothetical protein
MYMYFTSLWNSIAQDFSSFISFPVSSNFPVFVYFYLGGHLPQLGILLRERRDRRRSDLDIPHY